MRAPADAAGAALADAGAMAAALLDAGAAAAALDPDAAAALGAGALELGAGPGFSLLQPAAHASATPAHTSEIDVFIGSLLFVLVGQWSERGRYGGDSTTASAVWAVHGCRSSDPKE